MTVEQWIAALLLPFMAYLLGSIPFGLLIGLAAGRVDVRKMGSGNIGASNVRRSVGTLAAVATLLGDVAKGYVPVWGASLLFPESRQTWHQGYMALVGLCAFIGHLHPIFLKGRTGGKGVATAAGNLLAFAPGALGVSGLVFILTACGLNRISIASLAAAAVMPLAVWYATGSPALTVWAGLTAAWIAIRHGANIRRLISGREPPIWK
jgi:glycerol-3-phosphate acyltransferase PlsY